MNRLGTRNIVADEVLIGEDPHAGYGAVAQLYCRLRESYESNYRFDGAKDFYMDEAEM